MQIYLYNIFSLPFFIIFLIASFETQRIYIFDGTQFIYLSLVVSALDVVSKRLFPSPTYEDLFLCFLLRFSIVLALTFRFTIHFELMFVYGKRQGYRSIILQVYIQLSLHHSFFFLILTWGHFFHCSLEREEGREKEKERTSMWKRHQLVAYAICPLTGDRTCTPGMCPNQESNQRPFGLHDNIQSTKPHRLGLKFIWDVCCWHTIDFHTLILYPATCWTCLLVQSFLLGS